MNDIEKKSMIKESLNSKPSIETKVFGKISDRYKELLIKYCKNTELTELIKECTIDLEKANELSYMKNGEYPEKRNPLMKLLYDLENTKIVLDRQALKNKVEV